MEDLPTVNSAPDTDGQAGPPAAASRRRDLSRRTFLGLLAATGAALAGCSPRLSAETTTTSSTAEGTPVAETVTGTTPITSAAVVDRPLIRQTPVHNVVKTEVCVVGGGAAGIAAATAAASTGAETILIEESGVLGGNITRGLVNIDRVAHGGGPMVKGFFSTLLDGMIAAGKALQPSEQNHYAVIYDTDYLRHYAYYLARRAGAQVRLHSTMCGATVNGRRLTAIDVVAQGSRTSIEADIFIDCTGDGNLGSAAGVQFWLGDHNYHQIQGQTLMFHLTGVDFAAARDYIARYESEERMNLINTYQLAGFRGFMKKFRKTNPKLGRPQGGILMTQTRSPAVHCVSASEIYGNHITAPDSVMDLMSSLQEQNLQIHAAMKKELPGFKGSTMVRMAERPYLREGRRLAGLYELTADDVTGARKFGDGIARGWYPIDLHVAYAGGPVQIGHPGYSKWYDIPYRSLVSRDLDNLLMAGRCISVTHEALGSTRISPVSMSLGQAAGVAAAQCTASRTSPPELPAGPLREQLRRQGALL